MTVGQAIKALRKQKGLTQTQLGGLCGVSGASIGSYEKGTTIPKRRVVEKLASALGVPSDRLTEHAAPAPQQGPSDNAPLYDGVLAALKELYGAVEGRIILGEDGSSRKYYVVRDVPDSFVLYERDIAAIAKSARASLFPMAERLGSGARGA